MGKTKFFLYRNRPLVRKGKTLYYGYMHEGVVVMLTVKTSHKVGGLEVSDDVQLQLISTDPKIPPQDAVIKHSVRKGLFDSLDIAGIWIDRYAKKLQINQKE